MKRPQDLTHRAMREHLRRNRGGLTLLEVVLSLGILLVSLTALGQLISNGTRASAQARMQTHAILRCESKLAEIISGFEPLQSADGVPFEDDSDWVWSLEVVEVAPDELPDLLELRLTVTYAGRNDLARISYTLRRFLRDPAVFADAAATETTEAGL